MKLKYKFSMMELDNEFCAVPVGENSGDFRAVLQLNESGAKIIEYLSMCSSTDEVFHKLQEDYPDNDQTEIRRMLDSFLDRLINEGILIP